MGKNNIANYEGQRFDRVIVKERAGIDVYGSPVWRCICDCGNECFFTGGQLRRRKYFSCGCKAALYDKRSINDTLCWICKHATNKYGICSWARELKPVDGWKAEARKALIKNYKCADKVDTYYKVIECPLFEEG